MNKFDGEVFDYNKDNIQQVFKSDDEINEKYKRGEIRIITEQARYPIKSIPSMIESNDYKLNPEYQRRKRWDNERKSRLIESFIMNVPLPPIFLYETEYAKYEVMDGLQRLSTIYDFYKGKYSLEGLEYWTELNGKTYDKLPSEIREGINRRYLSSVILLQETAKSPEEAEELKQIVFERLNSGGEKLTDQETRNALYNGKFNKLCIELAENIDFRKMWKIPTKEDSLDILDFDDESISLLTNPLYKKMEDVELVLRFFAYRFLDKYTSNPMKDFLDAYLKQANKFNDTTTNELKNLFNETIDTVYKVFGKDAFLLPEGNNRKSNKITKTIYEPLMQSISKNLNNKEKLISNSEILKKNKFLNLEKLTLDNGKKLFDGKYSHRSIIQKRIEYFDELIYKYCNN